MRYDKQSLKANLDVGKHESRQISCRSHPGKPPRQPPRHSPFLRHVGPRRISSVGEFEGNLEMMRIRCLLIDLPVVGLAEEQVRPTQRIVSPSPLPSVGAFEVCFPQRRYAYGKTP